MTHLERLMKRRLSLLATDIIMHAWNDGALFARRTGLDTKVSNFEFVEDDAWFDTDWFEEVISAHWNDDPGIFESFVRRGREAGGRLLAACKRLDPGSMDASARERVFWRTTKLLQNLAVFIPVTHPLSLLLERKVTDIVRDRGVPEADIEARILELSVPVRPSGPDQELRDLLRIRTHRGDPGFDLEAALTRHCRRWEYLGYRDPFSSGYALEFFRNRLDDPGTTAPIRHRARSADLGLDPQQKTTVHLLREFVWFRNYRTEKLFEALFLLEPLWAGLSYGHGLGDRDIFNYLLAEVSRLLTHGERVPAKKLEARRAGHALLLDGDRFRLLTGGLLERKEASLSEPDPEPASEIRGMVVCRGRAVGRVTIVHDDGEIDRVRDGDILVTGMTTPDFLPAMRKAAAFVTDEGGITCHAAITAREIGKPCIVGTRCATRVLTEGDTVEVDAEAGVVRVVTPR